MPASENPIVSFLGTGWSFPPRFQRNAGAVTMVADEEDIRQSLEILFHTAAGERFLNPGYGLDLQEMLFDSLSTTAKTFLEDKIKTAILIHEARIKLISLELDTSEESEGRINIVVTYEVKATNSRYNLVYPFNLTDANELRSPFGAR